MHSTDIIGMLHIPVNTILAAPAAWRRALGLPAANARDWQIIDLISNVGLPQVASIEEHILNLSFYPFLRQRMLEEAALYSAHGINSMMLENVGAPYFSRNENPTIIPCLMNCLAKELRRQFPTRRLGIQVLAFADNLAMQIALRNRFQFIRCESALFQGTRPEGTTPNAGNLAQLYYARNRLSNYLGDDANEPKVYVDLQKKHTAFPAELQDLDLWLDNVGFTKLEGIILTGTATGKPVDEMQLTQARKFLDGLHDGLPSPDLPKVPLIIGSGATPENFAIYMKYADEIIIGSSIKERGNWENPIDPLRLEIFSAAVNAARSEI